MSFPVPPVATLRRRISPPIASALLLLAGWLALYAPVYSSFMRGAWTRDENSHAPFLLAICIGAAYARLANWRAPAATGMRDYCVGGALLIAGLCAYAAGRLAQAEFLSSTSQFFVASGAAALLLGVAGVRRLWFPLAMTLYLVIWPGWIIDTATAPLKQWISEFVSELLFAFGLPVSNTGAVISAGSYELLVAQACSGLNSLIALTSVGALYLYMVKRRSRTVNLAVLFSLAPIAIVANALRVTLLVLITYFAGYDAGQGFMHYGAGLVMFAAALGGVFLVDAAAAGLWERGQ